MSWPPPCRCCGAGISRSSSARGHGWCSACYQRWLRAGRPESGPPPPRRAGPASETRERALARVHEQLEQRMALFRELDAGTEGSPYPNVYGYPHLTDSQIAAKMGVSPRTVYRYRAADRAAGVNWWKPRGRASHEG